MSQIKTELIPLDLRARNQWVLWKIVTRGDKPTKVPFASDGGEAKSNDPATWSDFASAERRFQKGGFDGIGYMFHADDPFCGIDLDGCRDPQTGKVADWAREIVLKFNSYAEVSPSLTGVKLFVRGANPFSTGKKKELPEAERVSDKTPAIEVYDKLRYFAVTGMRLAGQEHEPQPRQEALEWLQDTYWPTTPAASSPAAVDFRSEAAVVDRARKYIAKMPPAISGQGGHNTTFHVACVLVLGFGLPEDCALALLREYNQTCNPPWSERELQHKISQAARQNGERNYLRNTSPERWQQVQVPRYEAPPPKHEPRMSTLAEAARSYVATLRDGKADLTTLGIGELDYAIGGGVEPGELVLMAARPSHGKSAVALQCAHVWTALGMPCLLVSEEMSALALGKRTLQFIADVPQEHWGHSTTQLDKAIMDYECDRAPAIIAECCGTTEAAIAAIDKAVEEHKIRAAIIDYAQILQGKGRTRYDQITATSVAMKQAAARHKIVLVLLCQLSREIEKRNKFLPVMSDIKETGQLEQDADVILFLVWPWKLNPKEPVHDYMFFVGKNRNRPINQQSVKCRFEPSRQMVLESKAEERARSHASYDASFEQFNARDF
jgi:KaiC/GvpD/RAD55 family RecA-like ATPase